MRHRIAVHQRIASFDDIAFLDRDRLALRQKKFDGLRILRVRMNKNPTLVLVILAEFHAAIVLGEDRVVLGPPGFEQLGHPRQTAGDVPGL